MRIPVPCAGPFTPFLVPGEEGCETWEDKEAYKRAGGVNAWAGFSLDEEKGIVFAPIGSATYDFYGSKRKGDNLYANCVLALDAETGKCIWHGKANVVAIENPGHQNLNPVLFVFLPMVNGKNNCRGR